MPNVVTVTRKIWRTLVPLSIRDAGWLRNFKHSVFKSISPNLIYDAEYYRKEVEDEAVRSADTIADTLLADFKPGSVVDVGCGTGALLAALRDRGCRGFGLEYSDAGLECCRARGLDVQKFDLEKGSLAEDRSFDVAISMEVAEHLAATSADRFVALLTRLSDRIVFTAAPPGQGGKDHVNEQPPAYWIQKFRDRGFAPDVDLAARWRQDWEASNQVTWYYRRNLLIFRREV